MICPHPLLEIRWAVGKARCSRRLVDPGPAIGARSSAQGSARASHAPTTTTRPAAAPSGARASPPRSRPRPCRRSPECRAPRRRLQTGLGLPWLGSETSFSALFGGLVGTRALRPLPGIARLPAGPLWSARRRVHGVAAAARPAARGAAGAGPVRSRGPGPGSRVVLGCGEHQYVGRRPTGA